MKVTAQGQNFTAAHPLLCHHLSHMSLVPSGIRSRIWSLLVPQTLIEVCPKGPLRAAGRWRGLGDTPKLRGDGPAACVCSVCAKNMQGGCPVQCCCCCSVTRSCPTLCDLVDCATSSSTCGGFPSKPFSNTSWDPTVLTLSAWGEHRLPWGRVPSSKTQDSRPSTSDTVCKSCPTAYRLEGPTTLSLDYFHFLEHHTEFREILCLMDYHFTTNGYNSGTVR